VSETIRYTYDKAGRLVKQLARSTGYEREYSYSCK